MLSVDAQGWRALARELEETAQRIRKIEAESRVRLDGAGPAERRAAAVVMMLFGPPQAAGG